ncbi:heme-binding beta-barrel domain-containing protein [Ghiorsea bivora]|uniref:heme-binding beta-barrel domain-containing protein n=1 Tax=Ghiorsea bivora TaxID=1485545 RepID=UPI0005702DC7|nr:heme-binding beta-barrel domain-containing protein [Ghiorsea bivora]
MAEINYGPLAQLIGTWKGDKGTDIAPEPNGEENNPYFETITYEAIGDVSNAETQTLAVLHYKQIVSRKENSEVFHHQSGYWSWDAETGVITHSFTIPRGVGVVACGKVLDTEDDVSGTVIGVSAEESGFDGGIAQSSFMQKKASTTAFTQTVTIDGNTMKYEQTIMLDIYSKTFEHTDTNTLTRQ